jgi:ribosomal protein S18 acetylase RimI-like enzyme
VTSVQVVPLERRHVDDARRVLVAAFDDDPVFRFLWPGDALRRRTLSSIMHHQAVIASQMASGHAAVDSSDRLLGAALWVEPGARKNLRQDVREAVSSWPAILRPSSLVTSARIFLMVERLRPKDLHWFLNVIGVDPASQGRGAGAALLELGLAAADDAGLVSWLETGKEGNLAWYERFGFELEDEIHPVAAAPRSFTMRRQPRST